MTRDEATELATLIASTYTSAKPVQKGDEWAIVTRDGREPPRTFKSRHKALTAYVPALEGSLSPVQFSFTDGEPFPGFSDGTQWNGFDNVWVTPETLAAIKASFYPGEEGADYFDALTPDAIGLIDLSNGFATVVDWPDTDDLGNPL